MSWPRGTAQAHGKRRLLHVNRSIAKIHFICRRPEEQIHSSLATNFFIFLLWSWILLEIGTGLKLERIHENADRNFTADAGLFSRNTDQFLMSSMQRSHGRDENRTRAPAEHVLIRALICFDYFHWDRARLLVDRWRTVCARNFSSQRARLIRAFREN